MARNRSILLRAEQQLNLSAAPLRQRGRLNRNNTEDMYRVDLTGHSQLAIRLKSPQAATRLELIQDRNGNGRFDRGEGISSLRTRRSRPRSWQSFESPTLDPGTYYLRVSVRPGQQSRYVMISAAIAQQQNAALPGGNGGSVPSGSTPGGSAPGGSAPGGSTPGGSPPAPTPSFVERVVQLTNAFRQQNGLQPLTNNAKLASSAQTHSQNMALQDFFAHNGIDGSTPFTRIRATGYNYSTAAENIAAGQSTPEAVVQGWINSPGHRANMLNAQLREIGVGYYHLANDTGNVNYRHYWTQNFGTPL